MRISRRFVKALFTSITWWLGLVISLVLHLLVMQMIEGKSRAQFEYHAENAQLAVQNRMRSYIDVLRGVNALFATSDKVTREQFRAYVTELNLERSFPGITNLNFAEHVPANQKAKFEAAVRSDTSLDKDGYPGFSIKPETERPAYHVLTYIEPLKDYPASFGLDIASNRSVEKALAVSRDSGQLTSSGRLIRIAGPNRHVGLAMRMPLYRRGMPLESVAERRAAYYGSVGAGFDVSKLMLGAVDKNILSYMRVKLYDTGRSDQELTTGTMDPERLLFDSRPSDEQESPLKAGVMSRDTLVKRAAIVVGPRVWEAEFSAPESAMMNSFDVSIAWMVLFGGIAASVLLFSNYYYLTTARRRAMELATEMTKDLRNSEASLAEAQHMARLGSWVLEPGTGKMSWSAETCRILDVDTFPGVPQYDDFLRRMHVDDRQRIREGLQHSIRSGEEFSAEHRIVQRDGSLRWVQTISRVGHDGRALLLRGTIMDITERKHTVEALQRSQELLRELTAYQDRVKEEERKRIAREIHDELGQTLLALRIDVSMLEARTSESHPHLNQKVRMALTHLDATVKTIRTIINNLRPAALDLGLTAAIEWQVAEFRRRTGISCVLYMSEQEFVVDDTRATSLFRILQESLTNVIRHAKATNVVIDLFQDDMRLVMQVTDNGIGINPENRKAPNSFGLIGIEERVLALNGEFQISSAPEQGTTLTVYIPLHAPQEDGASRESALWHASETTVDRTASDSGDAVGRMC
ncbi:hypothetical protein GCM10027343_41470 [Noviherbaspirillum agri]